MCKVKAENCLSWTYLHLVLQRRVSVAFWGFMLTVPNELEVVVISGMLVCMYYKYKCCLDQNFQSREMAFTSFLDKLLHFNVHHMINRSYASLHCKLTFKSKQGFEPLQILFNFDH